MDFNGAAIFVEVARSGGFTAAARRLGMPKTTVSKRIAELEAELGIRLLNRTTRRISMTEAGARVHAHCVEAMLHMAAARREAQSMQHRPEGMLRLAAPSGVINSTLIPLVTDFMANYPDISVTMLSVSKPPDLSEGGIDALVWVSDHLEGSAHARRFVTQVELALYASPDYLARRGTPRRPQDLAAHDAIAFAQALDHNRFAWHLTRGNRSVDIVPATQPRFVGDDAVPVFEAAARGLGVAALPIYYVAACGGADRLTAVLPEWRAPPVSLTAYFLDGSAASLKTRLFLDHAAAWFARSA